MYRQGLARDPDSLQAVGGLVDLDLLNNKPAQALRLIQEQLDSNPQNCGSPLLQGNALLQNKQPEEAARSMERAVELDGQNVSALVLLAEIESSLGKFDQSVANYQRAIGIAPNNVRLYVALGSLYERQGNWQQAQTVYQKALAMQPEDALAAKQPGLHHDRAQGKCECSAYACSDCSTRTAQPAEFRRHAGLGVLPQRSILGCRALLRRCRQESPGNLTYHYHLGLTLSKSSTIWPGLAQSLRNYQPRPEIAACQRSGAHALSQSHGHVGVFLSACQENL